MADIRKSAAIFLISMRQGRIKGVGGIAVQTALLHIVIDEGVIASRVSAVLQFRQAARIRRYWRKAFIFVRKTLQVRLRDQKALAFLARRGGPAFFDEDDVCDSK